MDEREPPISSSGSTLATTLTTPLARLREQLAGLRGMRRIDALLARDDAAEAIAALAPSEIYEMVHEVGFEDAGDLIPLATPEQIQGCFDLDAWTKDELDIAPLKPWLTALVEAGFEKLGEVWNGLDADLRALIFQRAVKVYDVNLGEEPAEDNDGAILATPDRFFMLELFGDDDQQRLYQQVIEDLYRADADVARLTIMSARSEPPAELEEQSYRWRAGRLADQGYVDFFDALDLFKPLEAAAVTIGEETQDRGITDEPRRLPLAVVEELIGRSFLARALAAIEEPEAAERIESALMVLVNKVLAAGRAKPGQAEVVKRGALYATSTLSLGLETLTRGDVGRATEALKSVGLTRLFRVGYTVTSKLARLALALAPRAITAGSPARELVAGLASPRPLLSRAVDDPPAAGLRPFESVADVRRASELLAGLTVEITLVESLGIDVLGAGLLPEPRPTLDDYVRTAIARVAAGGELTADALTQAELAALRAGPMRGGKLTPEVSTRVRLVVERRIGAAQLGASATVLTGLLVKWLAELEAILGEIADAAVDPRFVEGVLVEVVRD